MNRFGVAALVASAWLGASSVLNGCGDSGNTRRGSGGEYVTLGGEVDLVDIDEPTDTPPPATWSEVPTSNGPPPRHDKFASSKTCSTCHRTIYDQWSQSMHARGLTSPVMIAQANQVARGPLANAAKPDPQRICINCHAPTAANVTTSSTLPLDANSFGDEGVSCAGCHQFTGSPTSGGGGISSSYQRQLVAGDTYIGPLADPVSNTAHKSAGGVAFQQKNLTCANCHNVNLDSNHDGRIVNGDDLVLQRTFDEYSVYRASGGKETCTTCHMPAVVGVTRVADGMNANGPARVLHDHSFVGVDYSLDDAAQTNAQAAKREALLRSSARVSVDPASVTRDGSLAFAVAVENVGAGHNLPTGFAFVRQMWLEVRVTVNGTETFRSGVLTGPTSDLCDASTLAEVGNPLAGFIVGCTVSDDSLVNLQAKLVDSVTVKRDSALQIVRDEDGQPVLEQAANARETALQFLRGGGVARTRRLGGALGPLRPFERRSFSYRVANVDANASVAIAVRLMFRHLPPYFVRALAAAQPVTEVPQLAPLVRNIRTVEIGRDTLAVP